MEQIDIRWKQRFQNFDKAFFRLTGAIRIVKGEPGNVLLQAGLIQTYEFTFELAWKTLKDYLEAEGFTVPSPRATLRQAFQTLLPYFVDVIAYSSIRNDALQEHIDRIGISIYKNS